MYRFKLNRESTEIFKHDACCDTVHIGGFGRFGCTVPKGLLLNKETGSFALVHLDGSLTPGPFIHPPSAGSLELLRRQREKEKKIEVEPASTAQKESKENKIVPPVLCKQQVADASTKASSALTTDTASTDRSLSISTKRDVAIAKTAESTTALPGTFSPEVGNADGMAATTEPADTYKGTEVKDEVEKAKAVVESKGDDEEDWELIEGAPVDSDYVVIRTW